MVYHRLAHHNIEWCGILLDPPAAFHPGPAPVAPSDDNSPNDPDPEHPGPGWYERAQYTRTDFGPRGAGNYLFHMGRYDNRGGRVMALARSLCSLQHHKATHEREHRAGLAYIRTVLSELALVPRTVPAVDIHRLYAPVTTYVDDVAHGPTPPSGSTITMELTAMTPPQAGAPCFRTTLTSAPTGRVWGVSLSATPLAARRRSSVSVSKQHGRARHSHAGCATPRTRSCEKRLPHQPTRSSTCRAPPS